MEGAIVNVVFGWLVLFAVSLLVARVLRPSVRSKDNPVGGSSGQDGGYFVYRFKL
jgi:hypothetical protein